MKLTQKRQAGRGGYLAIDMLVPRQYSHRVYYQLDALGGCYRVMQLNPNTPYPKIDVSQSLGATGFMAKHGAQSGL
jgi:hypothetical protein